VESESRREEREGREREPLGEKRRYKNAKIK